MKLLYLSVICILTIINSQSQAPSGLPEHTQLAPGLEESLLYPTIVRFNDDRLFCVYSSREKINTGEYKIVVEGIFSDDHGISWSKPSLLIDATPMLSLDASIIVTSTSVIVNATVVPATHYSYVSTSKTLAVRSLDNGKTWSPLYEIPIGHRYVAGKINPGVTLDNGTSFFAYAWDKGLQSKEKIGGDSDQDCISGLMVSTDHGVTWKEGPQFSMDKKAIAKKAINGLDEPAIVECPDKSLYMLFRTGFNKLYESRSTDEGKTWSSPAPSRLKAHDAPAALCQVSGSMPGVVAVWNNSDKSRWPLTVAFSGDNGKNWNRPKVVANYPGQPSSYPGVVQAADGTVVIVWQQNHPGKPRTIEMKRVSLEWIRNTNQPE